MRRVLLLDQRLRGTTAKGRKPARRAQRTLEGSHTTASVTPSTACRFPAAHNGREPYNSLCRSLHRVPLPTIAVQHQQPRSSKAFPPTHLAVEVLRQLRLPDAGGAATLQRQAARPQVVGGVGACGGWWHHDGARCDGAVAAGAAGVGALEALRGREARRELATGAVARGSSNSGQGNTWNRQ